MLIDCVSFLDPFVYHGGGEMVTHRLIEIGRHRGHNISITSVRPSRKSLHSKPDITLLIDLFNHGHTFQSLGAWRSFGEKYLERVMARAPFVHLTTAYADVCNLPYLPCSGEACGVCPEKPLALRRKLLLRDFGNACFAAQPLVRRLFEAAALNVFQSPLHKAVTERVLGKGLSNSFILKPTIDTKLFKNHHMPRDIDYLFAGVLCEAKGFNELRERFGHTDIQLIGRVSPGTRVDFGRHIDFVPYSELAVWMNRAKNFVFLPRWPETQGRVVVEAALCGCKIIGNDHIGALSFAFDISDPLQYGDAEGSFWAAVEALI